MKFEIIDLSKIDKLNKALIENTYSVWKSVYEPILNEANEAILPDYFWKARMISVIHEKNTPVAFALHGSIPIFMDDVENISYFFPLSDVLKHKLKKFSHQILTIEWVTVNPEHRGKFTKVQPVDLIMGLSFKLLENSHWEASMGFSRTDLKADKVAEKFGVRSQGEVTRHDIHCKLMYVEKEWLTPHPFKKVQLAIDDLWINRVDHTSYLQNYEPRKVAI